MITEVDTLPALRGTWTMTAYEGDVEAIACDCTHEDWPSDLACVRCDGSGRMIINPIVFHEEYENLITNVGKAQILNRLFGLGAAAAMANIGVGTSATAAAVGDTTLTGAVYKVFDTTPAAATAGALSVTATTTFGTAEANINIQEAAVSTASPGVILNRLAPIGPFSKTSAVSLAMSITITQA